MTAVAPDPALTLADAARMMRGAVKDKSYRAYPLGGEAGHYLRWKRGVLTESSYRDYEGCLDKLALYFLDLELSAFEPPVGTELLEEWLDETWGSRKERTYNKNLSIARDFFKWACLKGKLHGDPTLPMVRRKTRDVARSMFSEDQERAIIAAQDSLRDRIALRLLFHTGMRKGSLKGIQFKHFDHARRRVMIFAKGGKVRELPIVDRMIWNDLERHILEWGAQPDDYLMCSRKAIPHPRGRGDGRRVDIDVVEYRDKPLSDHGLHDWWYRCLHRTGIVREGVTRGEKLHKTRYTAGQRMLDKTRGNLKATQALLGHTDIGTTADIYVDWDVYRLEESMREVLGESEK